MGKPKTPLEVAEENLQIAEAKAKADAEAKALADAQANAISAQAKAENEAKIKAQSAKKESTVTCFKGKVTKKVTAVNPKFPAGYKKK